ncbi:LANO_0F10220g1_1 [Lachancea nothofagi CBS 11611]|uniref:LANO_0F10220g1_1 n=1 Tax=Lachancea nothofagi CBS 11611 TaxID=1266666 RepID=A0A1G4KAA4_9SACH|nr:LANO_0F10220g1_1 [Lachancea nothofagi CBS 11611]
MPSAMGDGLTGVLSEIRKMKSGLIGDDLAKLSLFKERPDVITDVLGIALETNCNVSHASSQNLSFQALEFLLILLNMGQEAKQEIGSEFSSIVDLVFTRLRFQEEDSSLISLQKARLVNMCLGDCDEFGLENSILMTSLRATLAWYVHERTSKQCLEHYNTIIVELLTCTMKQNYEETNADLLSATHALLLRLSSKYQYLLLFKYITAETKASRSSHQYEPFSSKKTGVPSLPTLNTCPNAIDIRDPSDRSILYLSLNIYIKMLSLADSTTCRSVDLWGNEGFVVFMSSFLKSDFMTLRCASIKFMVYPYLCASTFKPAEQPLQLWLPHLCDCLNYDDLPWWFDPFDILTRLVNHFNEICPQSNPISDFLLDTNLMNSVVRLLAKCLGLRNRDNGPLKVTEQLIRLCASLTSFSETTRRRLFTNKSLLHHAEAGLESHLKLIDSFVTHKDIHRSLLEIRDLPPFYDSDCTLSWVLLLKSFSRSVTALRTFLKRNRLAELLLDLVKSIFLLTEDKSYSGSGLLDAELKIMSAALGILSNFVVEFSNLQSYIVENGIIDVVGKILKSPLFNETVRSASADDLNYSIPMCVAEVQTNALWVLRHLMYNSHNDEKLELLSIIPMEVILQFVNNGNWLVQEQCFQLLRNLTCNSRKVVNILLENFNDPQPAHEPNQRSGSVKSTYLFEYLAHKLRLLDSKDPNQGKTLEGVLYIIVNITAINESKRQMVIEQDEVLWFISEVLAEHNGGSAEFGHTKGDLQVACLWILTNLIWASTTSNFLFYATEPHPVLEATETQASGSNSSAGHGVRRADKEQAHDSGGAYDDEELSDTYEDDEDDSQEDEDEDDGDVELGEESEGSAFVTSAVGHPEEFERPKTLNAPAKLKIFAAQRCSKLVKMGLYDLVKLKTLETDIPVREQAKLLLFHMDLLRKGA